MFICGADQSAIVNIIWASLTVLKLSQVRQPKSIGWRTRLLATSDSWQLPFPVRFHSVSFFMHKNSIDCSPFYPLHNLFDPYSSLWVKTKSFMLCSAADKTENSSSGIRCCFLYYGKLSFKCAFSHRMANVNFILLFYMDFVLQFGYRLAVCP